MENIFVEFLPPWVETGLQPAFYDKESGTVLQQTARMYARVNMLVRMFNKLSKNTKSVVEDYIDKFNQLHDYVYYYFDNLDVQEEINNKLDDMTEQGTLQEIVAAYLNSRAVFGYDTVAEMKEAENLLEGSFAHTLGYTTKGDGGGATYKVRELGEDETADNMTLISLHDNLVAELEIKPEMTTRQFGSGTNDDLAVLKKIISLCDTIILSDNMTINPQQITLSDNQVLDLNGHKITMGDNNNLSFANLIVVNSTGEVTIKNGELDGNSEGQTVPVVTNNTGILVSSGSAVMDNMKIHNFLYEGVIANGNINMIIRNSKIYDCGRNDIALLSWNSSVIENCEFSGSLENEENIANIDIEPFDSSCKIGRSIIRNCVFKDEEKASAVSHYLDQNQTESCTSIIENCEFNNKLAVGYDRGLKSSYKFANNVFIGISDQPALKIYDTTQNIDFDGEFNNCAYPIVVDVNYTWGLIQNVKIKALCKGTITKGIEFLQPEGVMTYNHPLANFDIDIKGTNSIVGWKLLHNSVIKTDPLIIDDNVTLADTSFYSDIYLTGYGKYIEIDNLYNKSKQIGPKFTIHSDVNNVIRSDLLPQIGDIGPNGIIVPADGSSFSITLNNFNYNKFIVDNIVGNYNPRTV